MRCPIHFCLGQEMMPTILYFLLENKDYLLSHHRSHGYYLSKKSPLDKMIYEFYGRASGSGSGLTGSQELSFPKQRFYSGTILSGMFSIALGTAFAQKKTKRNSDITVTVIGDGGMEEGICFETLNIASLMNLPILFICENNNLSVHTKINERTNSFNYSNKVKSFGIKTFNLSDIDISIAYKKVKKVFNYVRKTNKPAFIEVNTMRICSHVGPESDDIEYAYRAELLNKWKNRDFYKKLEISLNNKKVKLIKNQYYKKIDKILSKAKKEKFLKFQKSCEFNFIKTFSKQVKSFVQNKNKFNPGQLETKIKAY